jgi:RNA polymerase sigma-70 factor (ECF subfamily)
LEKANEQRGKNVRATSMDSNGSCRGGQGSSARTCFVSETKVNPKAPGDVSEVVEHLFRHESGKLVATLTGIFGVHNLTLAEDVVQEALARALQTWPYYGTPDNPSAWLMRTAKNLALDVLRREKVFRDKEPQVALLMEQLSGNPTEAEALTTESEIKDDTLRMMFVCCHSQIPPEAQVALALKTLCGFGVVEIAKAFLTTEASIAKRLTRAKQKLRDLGIAFEIPAGAELSRRLQSVMQTLYLLFNEGYKASTGERLIKEELCREAVRLTGFLAEHPAGNRPQTHALLALMLCNAARLPARLDSEGNILSLKEQNRAQWDHTMIARAMFHLAQSSTGDEISRYHLEAGITACHCAANDYESTDWERILGLYDLLVAVEPSAVVALNRAVAVANVHGPEAGLAAVEAIPDREQLDSYYLFYAVLGDFESRRSNHAAAARFFRQSVELTEIQSERAFLTKRIQECEEHMRTPADEPKNLA